jgi:hypothetical protein
MTAAADNLEEMTAAVDFDCIEVDCDATVEFDLLKLQSNRTVSCTACHKLYQFDKAFIGKLGKLRSLIVSVKDAEDILGDCSSAVMTPAGEVKIPYRLLLTRLNTLVSLKVEGQVIDFNFRVEPLNDGEFR